ncbi:MAG: D-2-hydroxyacid dehydrogenase [Chitinophagaceae bacterium]|nr:MAG: D-2-hydroxyacid dehydrogenase [Chitinophagaceae bacterium]
MKIVVLDGYTLNPGDLDWSGLAALGELVVYERTPVTEIVSRASGAEVIFTNKTIVNAAMISELTALRFIGTLSTGYNIVDTDAAAKHGIVVCNVPGYGSASVVQLTFSLILEHFNQVALHNVAVKAGEWVSSNDFSFTKSPLHEISGKTIGIIGFGAIGQQVADVATAFGMHVIAYSRTRTDQANRKNFRWVDQDKLFKTSDIISIHCPLTEQTRGMINKQTLGLMKPIVFLVNTARGPIINETDLAEALNNNVIAGAGLDVLSTEPPVPDNPLLTARNCIITPHIAWATREARQRLMAITISNLRAYKEGKPVNIVNKVK